MDFRPERPTTPAELAEVVAGARAAGLAVYPAGGGTQPGPGYARPRPGVELHTAGLNRVVDYPARDLTVTAEAGVTVAELARVLSAEHQRLAVDIPHDDRATLGGSIAANVSGPRRLSFGTLRDALIGITVVTDEGKLTKAGGRVVKNVAGYDLMKLHTSAWGTLGVIAQVTLKVTPTPERQAVRFVPVELADLDATLTRLHQSMSRPAVVEYWSAGFAKLAAAKVGLPAPAGALLAVGFEEKADAVAWQLGKLAEEFGADPPGGAIEPAFWRELPDFAELAATGVRLRVSVPPGKLAAWLALAHNVAPDWPLQAHALSGVATLDAPHGWPGSVAADVLVLAAMLGPGPLGHLTVSRCPAEWAGVLPIWGRPRGDWPLQRAVHQALDPAHLFNPGRLAPLIPLPPDVPR